MGVMIDSEDVAAVALVAHRAKEQAAAEAYELKRAKDHAELAEAHAAKLTERHLKTKFAPGQGAKLKALGHVVLVEEISLHGGGSDHKGPSVMVCWIDPAGQLHREHFVEDCLEAIE